VPAIAKHVGLAKIEGVDISGSDPHDFPTLVRARIPSSQRSTQSSSSLLDEACLPGDASCSQLRWASSSRGAPASAAEPTPPK
jgi:hypothetical protein